MSTSFDITGGRVAPKAMIWTGRVISVLIAAMMIMSAAMKFKGGPQLEEGMPKLGWPVELAVTLGVLELASAVLYLIPQTAMLGAILLTGYLGGAIATHVRIGEAWHIQAGLGVLAWLGLFLRDARLWELVPWRRLPASRGADQ